MPTPRETFFNLLSKGAQIGAEGTAGEQERSLRQLLQQQHTEADAAKQASSQAFEKQYRDADRQSAEKIAADRLAALLAKTSKPSEAAVKREALIKENEVRAGQLKTQYATTPAWKQVVSRLPWVGDLAGEFDPQIRDLSGNETAIAQNETFIKSGAQAPESEFKRMRKSTLPGILSSPAKKAQVLDNALGARTGVGVPGNDLSAEEAAELNQLRKEMLGM